MNQEKIGKFISTLRKEKNMTQQDLADKIGVTDRAISKWENGRGLPDLSLLKPLSDELGITINELISGEKLNKKEYQNKVEENVLNTINYSKKQIKIIKNKFALILSFILIIITIFIILFSIDINRMRNNEPILFSTWGFDYFPPINLDSDKINNAIEKYIISASEKDNKNKDSKTFVSLETFLIEEIEEEKLYYVYSWVLEETYYLDKNELKEESGSSIPYKFVVERNDEEFKVVDSRIPRDGSYYSEDIDNIFPKSIRNQVNNVHDNGVVEKLLYKNKAKAEIYFNK